jgi:hypothetical protein
MKYKFFFSFFLFLLMLSSLVSAIGVSPPKITQEFISGEEFVYDIVVVNTANPSRVTVELEGSRLAKYVTLDKESFDLPLGQTSLQMTLSFPDYDDLEDTYGKQVIWYRIAEVPQEGGAFSAVTAVRGALVVNVPVPGQYGVIEDFSVTTVQEGENAEASLTIKNRGTIPLQDKPASINIFTNDDELLTSVPVPPITLSVDQEQTLTVELPTEDFSSARYRAEAEFYFDEEKNPTTSEDIFFVGATDIQLLGHKEVLEENKINQVTFRLQSLWSDSLTNVRASITDFDGNEQSLPVIDLEPFEAITVSTFLDVPALEEEPFLVTNRTHTPNVTIERILRLQFPAGETADEVKEIPISFTIVPPPPEPVKEEQSGLEPTTILLIGLGAVVILLVVVLLIVLFKGKPHDKKKKKK